MTRHFSRRNFLRQLGAAGAVAALPAIFSQIGCRDSSKRPNLVVFLADDLGYGDLACYGHPIIQSPHLDRFAEEGIRFTDAHSGGTVCSPSRAALLTGRSPYRVGIYRLTQGGAHLRREEITVAAMLKKAGYDTCFVGKWHLGMDRENNPSPGDHGFDHWLATERNAFEGPENPTSFIRNGSPVGRMQGWYCDIIVKEALSWLNARPDHDRPFFVLVCSHEPHTPVAPPAPYSSMYDTPEVDRLEDSISYGGVPRPKNKDIEDNKQYFYGTVTQLDNAFGTLMSGLDELRLRDNTLVWFTSDNGPESPVTEMESGGMWDDPLRDRCFGTPGDLRGMKRFTYEGGHRVPTLIRWPGRIPSRQVCGALINGTDIFPTLCAVAGIPVPDDRVIDGTDIAPLFKDRDIDRQIPAFWMFPANYAGRPHMAMREGDDVILGWFNEKDKGQTWMDFIKSAELTAFELYDLHQDVRQTENLADKDPAGFSDLRTKMKELWAQVRAEAPVWENWNEK